MVISKTLKKGTRKVQTFLQENSYYCGPATAKMVLRWFSVSKTQNQLWDAIQDASDALGLPTCEACQPVACVDWYTAPEALESVLKTKSQAPIKLVSETSAAATDHAIVWSLVNDIPAVALVFGWAHWVVVHGYKVDRVPTSMADTGYQLLGFHLIDSNAKSKARVFIPSPQWRLDYMTGVKCGRFTGRFVAVCDPEPPSSEGGPTVPRSLATSDTLLPLERLAKAALGHIKALDLMKDETWQKAMTGAKAGTTWLVHRLDRPRSFYGLVPFVKHGVVTAQALVDASSGELQGARVAEDVRRSLPMPCSAADAVERVARRRFDLKGKPQSSLRREGLSVSPTLVWKPCRESLSPFEAFSRVAYGDTAVYVRTDGEVFTQLSEPPAGG